MKNFPRQGFITKMELKFVDSKFFNNEIWVVTWISYDYETSILPVNVVLTQLTKVITANSAAESYQWVLWRQGCEQGTAECQQFLTGTEVAGNSCQPWSIKVASGLLQLKLSADCLLALSGDAYSQSCCLLPSQAPFTTHLGPPLRMRTCIHQKAKSLCLSLQNIRNSIKWVSGLN